MATVTCTVRVRKNGALSLPKRAREELGLQPGDEVEIQIRRPEATPEKSPRNPLYDIIGMAKEGPADGAENHDAYLYGKRAT
jgi:AbrB family looped-hinge helix DNA binding protein